ncbi:ABC transporter substrate-binding protein [Pararhodospirillum oryzae]|uniref:Peptide ABC transporter substrate-binding protein n=1 Tax=Pararhodospirillum oryzae TaxID=478448 RepID=A0A512HB54_9PROT|nr:ABC transporter substrate-binding protein [Pararhodospirillum oryzae]GEO82686.1 peptide ABC transporter substrate-binding protein [Pararhodospirillum oryzae]
MRPLLSCFTLSARLVVGVFMSLLAGASVGVADDAPTRGTRFVIADEVGDWGIPSPYLHDRRGPGFILTSLVFDTLIWKDATGAFVPSLAETWTVDDTGATFTLHPKARWHDGVPVTADDVVFTVGMFREFPLASLDLSRIQSVRALDDHTVRFEMTQPFAPFLATIAGVMPIVGRHLHGAVETPMTLGLPQAAIGSGPFRLEHYDRVQGATLFRANHAYHRGRPTVEEIAFVRMTPPVAVAGVRKGTVDLATSVPVRDAESLAAAGVRLLVHDTGHPVRLKYNTRHPVLADGRVRRAFAHFIDRKRVIETVYLGWAVPWDPRGLAPLADPARDPYPFDPGAGQRLLEQAGWSRTPDGPWIRENEAVRLDLLAPRAQESLARLIGQQLGAQGLGVAVRLLDRGAFDEALRQGAYDLALTSHGLLGDPDVFRQGVLGTRPDSDRYTANPDLVAALEAQVTQTDPARRQALLARAGELYARDLPSYVLVSPRRAAVAPEPFFFTPGGVGPGVPSVLNKLAFLP